MGNNAYYKKMKMFYVKFKIFTSPTILIQQNIDMHYVYLKDIFVLRRYIYSFGICVILVLYESKALVTINIYNYVCAYHYLHIYLTTIIYILTI